MDIGDFTNGEIPKETLAELQSHFDDPGLRLESPRILKHSLGCDVLVDVGWFEHDSDGPGHSVEHTVVFLHRPQTKLPEFEIRPRKGLGEKALGMLVSLLGVPTMEFEDEPDFSQRYSVVTANPESVRLLLGREAIDSLLSVDDLFLKFSGRGVLLSRRSVDGSSGGRTSIGTGEGGGITRRNTHDHRLDEAASHSLLEDALVAAGPIVDDPEVGHHAADAVEGTYAEEAVRHLTDQGGFVGRQMAKTLITSEMLNAVRIAATPRAGIPAQIARKAWGGTTFPLAIAPLFGLIFAGIGTAILIGGQIEGLAFLGVGFLALVISGFVLRHRLIRKRLITDGVVVMGRLAGVERTTTSVNDDMIHKITVDTQDGGEPMVMKMGSAPARQARRMMEENPETWILRDPRKASRGLWLPGWTLGNSPD